MLPCSLSLLTHSTMAQVFSAPTRKVRSTVFNKALTTNNAQEIFMDMIKLEWVVNSLVFSLIGVAVFWVSFLIIDKITPYDLWSEIVKERNQALAIVVGAMCLGIAIIVASSIHG